MKTSGMILLSMLLLVGCPLLNEEEVESNIGKPIVYRQLNVDMTSSEFQSRFLDVVGTSYRAWNFYKMEQQVAIVELGGIGPVKYMSRQDAARLMRTPGILTATELDFMKRAIRHSFIYKETDPYEPQEEDYSDFEKFYEALMSYYKNFVAPRIFFIYEKELDK